MKKYNNNNVIELLIQACVYIIVGWAIIFAYNAIISEDHERMHEAQEQLMYCDNFVKELQK